jgi:hypothetical protein
MKGNKIFKIFMTILLIAFIILTVYLLIDSGSHGDLIKSYDAVKPDSTAGFSKTLQFLKTYTQTTGDLSVAMATGMSSEDAEELANGNNNNNSNNNNNFSTLSLAEQVTALKTESGYNNSYYTNYLKQVSIDGHDYVWESQRTGAWSSFAPNGDSVASAGCFLYASAALVGAEMGRVYTIENLLTDLGGTVTTDASGMFTVSNSPISRVGGDISTLNRILSSSGCGKTATTVSSIDGNKLANGTMYLIYATRANGSSTNLYSTSSSWGAHWTAVVGVSSSSKYIVLCNGSREIEWDSSEFHDLKYIWEVD